jgi:molecular chaperone DnaK (HSP70)
MAGACFGVYFGSTSACIAVCKDGKTDVIANDAGDRVTPSVVAFTDIEQLVGLAAWQCLIRNPADTVCNVKMLLGRPFSHVDVESVVKSSPVKVVNNNGMPAYSVTYRQKTSLFSPVEIAAIIYKKMMETAESHSGIADSHDAVLSVPLSFDETQRAAIREAATKAGFNVLRIISEPSAALLAYNIGQLDVTETCNALMLRVGGQSADVAVITVNSGMYRVLASVSDSNLGGHVIDDLIVEHFAAEFQRQFKLDLRQSSRAIGKLHAAVETCKRVLSTLGTSQCSVDSLYEGLDFNSTLSRSRFEALSGPFVQSCLRLLGSCLNKAELTVESIHRVILCGGCCRIPLLQQQVQEYFSTAEMLTTIPSDEVIAVGCALEASILKDRDEQERETFAKLCDLQCLSADIIIQVNSDDSRSVTILPRLTPVPVRRQKMFTLNANEVSACISVLQRIKETDEISKLAEVTLSDLPEAASLNIVCHFRHDGILHVTCSESTTSRSEDVLIESLC